MAVSVRASPSVSIRSTRRGCPTTEGPIRDNVPQWWLRAPVQQPRRVHSRLKGWPVPNEAFLIYCEESGDELDSYYSGLPR